MEQSKPDPRDKRIEELEEENRRWRALYLDKPEDRLWHDADGTWWARDDTRPTGVGSLVRAAPPAYVLRLIDERDAARASLADTKALLDQLVGVPWADRPDEWSAAIEAAFPTRSNSHKEYCVAMKMVGNRHSKGELVSLVNWLLVEQKKAT